MSEPEKQGEKRNPDGTFARGVSGNPKGRPKGLTITELLRQQAEQVVDESGRTKGEMMAEVAFRLALEGDMRAIEFIIQRLDGKVPDNVQVSGDAASLVAVFRAIGQGA